jgi:hypothetical protein
LCPDKLNAVPREIWFFVVLAIVLAAALHHSQAVQAAGLSPRAVRSRLHAALNLLSMIGSFALLPATVVWHTFEFLPLVPAGFAIGLRNMAYASRADATWADVRREHLVSVASAIALAVVGVLVWWI